MEKTILKEQLIDIKNNKCKVPKGIEPLSFSMELLDYLGDSDEGMRDELVYHVIVNWIIEDILTFEEVKEILNILLSDDYLRKGQGRVDDSVFKRSYSILVIGCIIYQHRSNIEQDDQKRIYSKVLAAFNAKNDIRGFIKGKSFAHSAAHGADALFEISQFPTIDAPMLKEILYAVRDKICVDYYGYYHFEDERMISVIKAIMARNLISEAELIEWLESFNQVEAPKVYKGATYEAYMV